MARSLLQHRYSVNSTALAVSSHCYSSGTFPRRRMAAKEGAKARVDRGADAPASSAETSRAASQTSSNLDATESVLPRSKSLQDLREDLVRTSRSALEKCEESELVEHRSGLAREIQVRVPGGLAAGSPRAAVLLAVLACTLQQVQGLSV